MALYWPKEKVAVDIIDDPARRPFDGDESYTVLRVTVAELCDSESYHKLMERLCELLGKDWVSMPEYFDPGEDDAEEDGEGDLSESPWSLPAKPDSNQALEDSKSPSDENETYEILAPNELEGEIMAKRAELMGNRVRGITIWDGPVPPGSFEMISPLVRMSTPEYFFLRKANQLSLPEAVRLGIELCGKYRTIITQYDCADKFEFLRTPRTTKSKIRKYLRGASNTKEGKRAMRVLRLVTDKCSTPMGCFLYLMLCLPVAQGGYGLVHPSLSAVYTSREGGYLPSSEGSFIAYDLVWPSKQVALQYTGKSLPDEDTLSALSTKGMRVICVTDGEIENAAAFDAFARRLFSMLDEVMPYDDDRWCKARDELRNKIEVPTYDHMLLTAHDLMAHYADE